MRKIFLALLLTFVFVPMLSAGPIGIGGFGGANIPIVQEDQSTGAAFGLHGKIKLIPALVAEGNLTFSKYGETTKEISSINNTIEGSKVNSYGIDLLLVGRRCMTQDKTLSNTCILNQVLIHLKSNLNL